jgi:hypothetical protein
MTTEELKKKEAEKAANAAKRSLYTSMAKYHQGEVERYKRQADAADPIELEAAPPPGDFAGL